MQDLVGHKLIQCSCPASIRISPGSTKIPSDMFGAKDLAWRLKASGHAAVARIVPPSTTTKLCTISPVLILISISEQKWEVIEIYLQHLFLELTWQRTSFHWGCGQEGNLQEWMQNYRTPPMSEHNHLLGQPRWIIIFPGQIKVGQIYPIFVRGGQTLKT